LSAPAGLLAEGGVIAGSVVVAASQAGHRLVADAIPIETAIGAEQPGDWASNALAWGGSKLPRELPG